ncbi:hypothetical protein [uncultured Sulfitobacter sp.]|uniref:hypothetical protein n=1 Tax=uncultured Sulfitobacter sp. TaxID=191468 RepID=UPI00261A72A1|nr:hypothetical protein [uncultured Sulfitobacter sp.]
MAPIEIAQSESGVIRVFSVSRPMSEMARDLKQQTKAQVARGLLDHPVSDDDFELFALSDLAGVGLPSYLAEGYALDPQVIHSDKRRLEALDGYVLVLFSGVASEQSVSLTPGRDLTLIGTYAEPRTSHAAAPIPSDSAKPYTGVAKPPETPKRGRGGSAMVAITVVVALLLLWWIFA